MPNAIHLVVKRFEDDVIFLKLQIHSSFFMMMMIQYGVQNVNAN